MFLGLSDFHGEPRASAKSAPPRRRCRPQRRDPTTPSPTQSPRRQHHDVGRPGRPYRRLRVAAAIGRDTHEEASASAASPPKCRPLERPRPSQGDRRKQQRPESEQTARRRDRVSGPGQQHIPACVEEGGAKRQSEGLPAHVRSGAAPSWPRSREPRCRAAGGPAFPPRGTPTRR